MTIEFESQVSRLLAVSVPKEAKLFKLSYYGRDCLSYKVDNINKKYGYEFQHIKLPLGWFEIIGLSTDHPEHHEAMKKACIFHENPYGDDPLHQEYYEYTLEQWQEAQQRVSEVWILLKIKE